MKKVLLFFLTGSLFATIIWASPQTEEKLTTIDFSYCGYKASERLLPDITPEHVSVTLLPVDKQDADRLQAAIRALEKLPVNECGFRGVIQLGEGIFKINHPLHIRASGIIVRGCGNHTRLVATYTDRQPVFVIQGTEERFMPLSRVSQDVEVGSLAIRTDNASAFAMGERITIRRPSTAEWISHMQADTAKGNFVQDRTWWLPGHRDVHWHRVVKGINDDVITLDAPLTLPLEERFGGGEVGKAMVSPLVNVGIQDLCIAGAEDDAKPHDEEHPWTGVHMDAVEDAWVKNVHFTRFCGSAVRVGRHGRRITIEGCTSFSPQGEDIGYRKQAFYVEGGQVLVTECRAEEGLNDFVAGLCAAGPNAFVNNVSVTPHDDSGAWESFACGTLFENIDLGGGGLFLTHDAIRTQGAWWTAAYATVWNCYNGNIRAQGHPWAPNQVVESEAPLFETLQKKRIGKPLATSVGKVVTLADEDFQAELVSIQNPIRQPHEHIELTNGRFVLNGRSLLGRCVNDAWWLGSIAHDHAPERGLSVTRFTPGRYGHGQTEDITLLVDSMLTLNNRFYENGPCLWYDRRRDDHLHIERSDGYVWAPFYELPWARTGEGKSWDGTSLYDLTTFNTWYFNRVKLLAEQCDEKGIVMFHSLFNTHNVLEIAPHWCDYPARPANCINPTMLPEPMPLEPRGRLHVGNEYYSVKDTALLHLHTLYINKVLDELGKFDNILFCVAFQYSGPLDFLEYFHRTVSDWEKRNNKQVKLLLRTDKASTDAIMANPEMARQVAAIDIRYWTYEPDGTLFAPLAGQNLAFRELIGKKYRGYGGPMPLTTPYQTYRQIREYTDRYPDKAIIAWKNEDNILPAVMAGAAQIIYRNPTAGHGQRLITGNPFETFFNERLATIYHRMKPIDGYLEMPTENWAMCTDDKQTWALYSINESDLVVTQDIGCGMKATWYQPDTKKVIEVPSLDATKGTLIDKPDARCWLLILQK